MKRTPDNSNFNFKFRLESNSGEKLMESYIGVYIAVEYDIVVEFKSAYAQLFKNSLPFFVQVPVTKTLFLAYYINFPILTLIFPLYSMLNPLFFKKIKIINPGCRQEHDP